MGPYPGLPPCAGTGARPPHAGASRNPSTEIRMPGTPAPAPSTASLCPWWGVRPHCLTLLTNVRPSLAGAWREVGEDGGVQGGRATQCSTCVAGPSSSRKVHAHAREVGTRSLGWTSWSSFLLYGDHLSLIKLPTIIPASHGFPRGAAGHSAARRVDPEAAATLELTTVTWQEDALLALARWLWRRKCGNVTAALLRGPRSRGGDVPYLERAVAEVGQRSVRRPWPDAGSGVLHGLSFDLWLSGALLVRVKRQV